MTVISALTSGRVQEFLNKAVTVNGSNRWDPQINNEAFYGRVAADGFLGLGETYVDGLWDCEDLFGFFCRVLQAGLLEFTASSPVMKTLMTIARTTNRQTRDQARANAIHHYTKGNDLFEATLGRTMAYTCAFWRSPKDLHDPETLDGAQTRKLELICRKLFLERGMSVLDLGCGWGPFMLYAAKHYGVRVVGLTPAADQVEYIRSRAEGLPVEVVQADYREAPEGPFDRVLSIGMLEHVGAQNYRDYMETVERCLAPGGLAFSHCFGRSHPGVPLIDPFTEKYIFRGMELPTLAQLVGAAEGIFDTLDVEEIGAHYPRTLLAWHENFEHNWKKISHRGEEFRRLWRYYLLSCAAGFRVRKVLLWQVVYARAGAEGAHYRPVRSH